SGAQYRGVPAVAVDGLLGGICEFGGDVGQCDPERPGGGVLGGEQILRPGQVLTLERDALRDVDLLRGRCQAGLIDVVTDDEGDRLGGNLLQVTQDLPLADHHVCGGVIRGGGGDGRDAEGAGLGENAVVGETAQPFNLRGDLVCVF